MDLYVSFKVVKSYTIVMNWLYETFSSTAWIIKIRGTLIVYEIISVIAKHTVSANLG